MMDHHYFCFLAFCFLLISVWSVLIFVLLISTFLFKALQFHLLLHKLNSKVNFLIHLKEKSSHLKEHKGLRIFEEKLLINWDQFHLKEYRKIICHFHKKTLYYFFLKEFILINFCNLRLHSLQFLQYNLNPKEGQLSVISDLIDLHLNIIFLK